MPLHSPFEQSLEGDVHIPTQYPLVRISVMFLLCIRGVVGLVDLKGPHYGSRCKLVRMVKCWGNLCCHWWSARRKADGTTAGLVDFSAHLVLGEAVWGVGARKDRELQTMPVFYHPFGLSGPAGSQALQCCCSAPCILSTPGVLTSFVSHPQPKLFVSLPLSLVYWLSELH